MRFAVLVVLGLALFTAGCGDDDGETSSSPTATVEAPIPDPMSVGGLADGRPEGEVHVLGFVVIDAAGAPRLNGPQHRSIRPGAVQASPRSTQSQTAREDVHSIQNEIRTRNGQLGVSHEHSDMPMFVQW